ncbi:MAG: hypothetical protein HQL54_03120 [Magnetococcales bacterium]|nr:hypothetical protein [Magnetococcales bacterium]
MFLRFNRIVLITILAGISFYSELNAANQSMDWNKELTYQTLQLDREVKLFRTYRNLPELTQAVPSVQAMPNRILYSRLNEINQKIQSIRQQNGFPVSDNQSFLTRDRQPVDLLVEALIRIRWELVFLNKRLGHPSEKSMPNFSNQKSKDTVYSQSTVYDQLNHINRALDGMVDNSHIIGIAFGNCIRIHHDIDEIIRALGLNDQTSPPNRVQQAQSETLLAAFSKLLNEVRQIQRPVGVERISGLNLSSDTPKLGELLGLSNLIVAELQPIKTYLGLANDQPFLTTNYRDKQLGDILQLLAWGLRKIKQIQLLQVN